MTITAERLKHFIWCVRNQMEKCWDFREELADALGELEQLRAESQWVKVSPETMPKLGESIALYGPPHKSDDESEVYLDAEVFGDRFQEKDFEAFGITHYFRLPSGPTADR